MRVSKFGWVGAAVVLSSCIAVGAMAQDAAGQPPAGGGQRRGGGQGRGGFGQGRFGAGAQLLLVNVPIDILVKELKLTDDQKTTVTAAQTKYQTDLRASFQPAADGTRPDRTAMQAKMKEINDQATKDIGAALKDDQKTDATALVKNLQMLRMLQIPYQTYSDLKLTSEQKTKLAAVAADVAKDRAAKQQEIQAATQANDAAKAQELQQAFFASLAGGKPNEKASAILTADQKDVIDKWQKANPQRGGGGRRFGPGAGAAAAAPAAP